MTSYPSRPPPLTTTTCSASCRRAALHFGRSVTVVTHSLTAACSSTRLDGRPFVDATPRLGLRASVQTPPALPLMRDNPHRHLHGHTRAWQCAHASTEDDGRGSNCEGGYPQLARRAVISGPPLC